MRNLFLAAGVAALALAAPASADPKGQGGGPRQAGEARHGGAKSQGGAAKAEAKAQRSPAKAEARAERQLPRAAARTERAKPTAMAQRQDRMDRDNRIVRQDIGGTLIRKNVAGFGCPPGLDRKDNGCLPPGQAKKLVGAPLAAAFAQGQLPLHYRNWYPDTGDHYFRSGDGFIYRVDRSNNLVDGLIPLFGSGYYALGDQWPAPYDFYNVPYQYRGFWPDGGDSRYRYSDGAIYRVDPSSNAVGGIVALLAGDLGVGARLPAGYDAYNLPLSYRSQYADSSDNWYRYNDGFIYRVDPATRLITAVIDTIV